MSPRSMMAYNLGPLSNNTTPRIMGQEQDAFSKMVSDKKGNSMITPSNN